MVTVLFLLSIGSAVVIIVGILSVKGAVVVVVSVFFILGTVRIAIDINIEIPVIFDFKFYRSLVARFQVNEGNILVSTFTYNLSPHIERIQRRVVVAERHCP